MPASKKRKGRGSGVPLSVRQHGTLDQMQARRKTDWGPYDKPMGAPGTPRPASADSQLAHAARTAASEGMEIRPKAIARPGRLTPKRVAIGAGVAGAAVGTGYLVHRHQQKKVATMSKSLDLVNPFEEVVAFGKAYPRNVTSGSDVRILRALVPTGRHIGHGNKLTHVTHGSGGGRNATRLERYTATPKGQRVGPFGKAAGTGTVQRSLELIAAAPKPTKVASQKFSTATPRIGRNSNIPDGARAGRKL